MPIYASYVRMTAEGAEHIKDSAQQAARVAGWVQEAGGKVLAAYATMGRYDYLYITEFPDNKAGWPVLAKNAKIGWTSTESVEIIPLEEWLQMVANL